MFKAGTLYRNLKMKDVDMFVVSIDRKRLLSKIITLNVYWISRRTKKVMSSLDSIQIQKSHLRFWKEIDL